MSAQKRTILFIHSVFPNQFTRLCQYLNNEGIANAYQLTTPGHYEKYKNAYRNLLAYKPDGNIVGNVRYYFSGKLERSSRISVGLHRKIKSLMGEIAVDVIVAHGTWGAPHFLFDEFGVPIITYIEFPCYRLHGWDEQYPPTESQRLVDKNMEMLSYYEVLKSDLTVTPSNHAKRMFPKAMQDRIAVQFEGFDEGMVNRREPCIRLASDHRFTIGFAARDLSSAKGLESFVLICKRLTAYLADVRFVILGDEQSSTYGYERQFLDNLYGAEKKVSFLDHVLRKHDMSRDSFTILGKLSYEEYSDCIYRIDMFVYPLKFGSGNWGLMEILLRGKVVVAANSCYLPEMIEDGVNGVLIDSDDPEAWTREILALISDPARRARLEQESRSRSRKYLIQHVARDYMQLFNKVIEVHTASKLPSGGIPE